MTFHDILKRQLKDHFGTLDTIPHDLVPLFHKISETYEAMSGTGQQNNLTEQKLAKTARLYAIISQVNHTILHYSNEQTIYDEVCRICVETGHFNVAWIALHDLESMQMHTISHNGLTPTDLAVMQSYRIHHNGPTEQILTTNKPFIINDMRRMDDLSGLRDFGLSRGWGSYAAFPIYKKGSLYAIFNICSAEDHFFDNDDVDMLKEIASELSYALTMFEQERLREDTERRLRESELRLKQTQAIAKLGSWELNFQTGVAIWSEEALNIYGIPASEFAQSFQSWLSYIHPEDKPTLVKAIEENGKTLSDNSGTFRIVRRDGEVRHVYSHSQFIIGANGAPTGMFGIEYDITSIKRTEEALSQAKANLRLIVDLVPQAISAMNEDGKFVFANKQFADLFGLTTRQILETDIQTLSGVNSQYATSCLQDAKEVICNNKTIIAPERQFVTASGKTLYFHSTKAPIKFGGTSAMSMLNISMDITDQRNAEEERSRIIADMVQRNKDLEQFSYIVSHNLRSPVANIIGLINLLTEGKEDDKQIAMASLPLSAQKLDEIIRDLNYILQVKHDIDEKLTPIKLSDLVADVRVSIASLLNSEHVTIDADFTAIDELQSLRSYLYSIFFNLITNSIKYKRPGAHPHICIRSVLADNKVIITFQDNGMGINLNLYNSKVFGLYKRFHTHTDGKGMGLYMVKTQVEKLGGKISIDSEVNIGTTFTITLSRN